MSRMWNTRLGFTVMAGCIGVMAGCSGGSMSDWDWFGMKKKEEKPRTRATAGTNRPATGESTTASAPPKTGADDAKAREVDEKVEQYVSSMNPRYQQGYESNDFNSKIRRQEDPNRNTRIQQTATRHRNGDSGPDRTLPDDSKMAQPAASDASPVYGARTAEPGTAPGKHDSPAGDADDGRPQLADPNDANDPLVKPQPAMQRDDGSKKPTASGAERPSPANKPVGLTPGAAGKPATEDEPLDDELNASETDAPTVASKEATSETAPGAAKRPPVITNLSVEASDEPMAKKPDAPTEGASTPASLSPQKETVIVDTLKQRIEEQEAKVAADPNNVEEQFRLRILYLANGQDDKALAAIDGINADVLEIMRAQLSALMTARSSAQRDPATWANRQFEAIEKLRHLVAERADLRVSKVVICRSISQFGQYEPIDPPTFKVGAESRFLLYVPIENFKCERTESGQFRTLLSLRFSLIDPEGRERWTDKIENVEDISRDRRSDFFFGYPENGLKIPKQLGEGEYTIKVEVEDVLAQKINSNTVKFKLVP